MMLTTKTASYRISWKSGDTTLDSITASSVGSFLTFTNSLVSAKRFLVSLVRFSSIYIQERFARRTNTNCRTSQMADSEMTTRNRRQTKPKEENAPFIAEILLGKVIPVKQEQEDVQQYQYQELCQLVQRMDQERQKLRQRVERMDQEQQKLCQRVERIDQEHEELWQRVERLERPQDLRQQGQQMDQPSYQERYNGETTANQQNTVRYFLVVLCMVILLGGIALVCVNTKPDNDYRLYNYEEIFRNNLTEMRRAFPNQTPRFWSILQNRGVAHLRNKNPDRPLVIMLGAPPSARAVVDCLAVRFASSLDPERKRPNVISGADYSRSEGHKTKKILDRKLEGLFRDGVRSVLVVDLDRLPSPSQLLFHQYCDSETAPYKRPAIIFTVKIPQEPSPFLQPVQAEELVEKYLADVVWRQEDFDATAALLSRVADTVAIVRSEDEQVLRAQCKTN